MCLENYEFHILDQAFLVHNQDSPIRKHVDPDQAVVDAQAHLIRTKIEREARIIHGAGKKTERCKL